MTYLLDTNVAVRCVMPTDPQYPLIRASVLSLISNGELLFVSAQVLNETWSLLTRPAESRGGYGQTVQEADALVSDITALAPILPEPPDLWKTQHKMLIEHMVSGVQTHDCRIAAWCILNGVDAILSLNTSDFGRFGVRTVTPTSLNW